MQGEAIFNALFWAVSSPSMNGWRGGSLESSGLQLLQGHLSIDSTVKNMISKLSDFPQQMPFGKIKLHLCQSSSILSMLMRRLGLFINSTSRVSPFSSD